MKTDLIIFAGQSNMQGMTECLPVCNDPVPNALEYRYLTDSLIPLRHPVGENIDYNERLLELDYISIPYALEKGALLGTWAENAAMFTPGQTVAGIIRSVESYGVFIELAPNLAGLAELRDDIPFLRDADVTGRMAAVYIKSIIPERMKIKLVLVDSYKGDLGTPTLEYFIDCNKTTHLDSWRYSPPECNKVIETIF